MSINTQFNNSSINFPLEQVYPSEILFPTEEATQQSLVENWISHFGTDYIAHAIWNGNFSSVVEMKEILPSEAILRMKEEVEYEKGGTFGSRGITKLAILSPEKLNKIDQYNLTSSQNEQLSELEIFFEEKKFSNGEEYLSKCNKYVTRQLDEYWKLDLRSKYWREAKEHIENHTTLLTPDEEEQLLAIQEREAHRQIQYENPLLTDDEEKQLFTEELIDNKNEIEILFKLKFRLDVIKLKKSQLRYLKRLKETGISFNEPICSQHISYYCKHDTIDTFSRAPFNSKKCLSVSKLSEEGFGKIAYDQAKNCPIDHYLAHKYTKWMQEKGEGKRSAPIVHMLYKARMNQLLAGKLTCEIRAARNSIYWTYGNIVLLRGNPKEIILGDPDLNPHVTSGEVFLLPPWMNGGKFLSLPLVQDETIILGKRELLEPFAESLIEMGAKYVYIENLTEEQKSFFNCPS